MNDADHVRVGLPLEMWAKIHFYLLRTTGTPVEFIPVLRDFEAALEAARAEPQPVPEIQRD